MGLRMPYDTSRIRIRVGEERKSGNTKMAGKWR
jgi:hypothetical protein